MVSVNILHSFEETRSGREGRIYAGVFKEDDTRRTWMDLELQQRMIFIADT